MTDRPTEDEIVEIGARALARYLYGNEEAFGDVDREFRAALVDMRAAGLVVVPVEPTEAMLADGVSAAFDAGLDGEDGIGTSDIEAIYRAMIAAALPAPPATGGEG